MSSRNTTPVAGKSSKEKKKMPTSRQRMGKKKGSRGMDERFSQVLSDPRFKSIKRSDRKVKVDSRFKAMFTDKKFQVISEVDRRGQSVTQVSDKLKAVYDVDEEEDTNQDKLQTNETEKKDVEKRTVNARGFPEDSDDEDMLSSSSDESLSEDEGEEVDHPWGELDRDVPRDDKTVSRRLAVCNMDWDRIKAQDIFVLFNSFKPESGSIVSVKIYASEFGKNRMQEEIIKGPQEIVQQTRNNTLDVLDKDGDSEEADGDSEEADDDNEEADDDSEEADDDSDDDGDDEDEKKEEDEDDDEVDEVAREKIRQYQLNRLKYFYAVLETDSTETALSLYKELDGFEYESSAASLDLRFIPDDMAFDEEPTQECASMPDMASYRAPIFMSSALQQSKVNLTWDETDPDRKLKINRVFNDLKDEAAMDDLTAFLASDEDEESDDDDDEVNEDKNERQGSLEDKMNKYKQLLQDIDKKEDGHSGEEVEISFGDEEIDDNEEDSEEEKLDEDDLSEEVSGSKKSNSKKKRKGDSTGNSQPDLDLLVMDEEKKNHFNYKDIVEASSSSKRKTDKKSPDDDGFTFDPQDARFSSIYSSPSFNVDPSDPHFKKTPAMMSILDNKSKKRRGKK